MKMLKVMALLSLLMLVVSCGGSTGATGAAKKYIIATDATYAPFEFQENGKYIGIDVDLITEIAKVEGFEFELKPMDSEEAVLQMNMLGHSFFVFEDAETEETNIVYRRKDGKYGLIETN